MGKRELNYLKCIVIVHGKSEKQIADFIKRELRFHMEVISNNKGNSSIQINGLQNFLFSDWRLKSFKNFCNQYPSVEIVSKKQITSSFKIFIIMDTDDCSEQMKQKFISKELFKGHWAYEYIVPIYNSNNLENVMQKAGINFKKRGRNMKSEYISIFPTEERYRNDESVELTEFSNKLSKISDTNMDVFISFCLDNSK